MSLQDKILEIQAALQDQQLDGWLGYDFRKSNPLVHKVLEISHEVLQTRRFYYWIPAQGEPVAIVHAIEQSIYTYLPGKKRIYAKWQELEQALHTVLSGQKRVAMEYSPKNAIPYISLVDGGTIDQVRGYGVEVVSSADLLQRFTALLTPAQMHSHFAAADFLDKTVAKAWDFIQAALSSSRVLTEFTVAQFILGEFRTHNFITDEPLIIGTNAHAADPHYIPTATSCAQIKKGDFILIDIYCKGQQPEAIYADITRVGVAAAQATAKQQEVFEIVKRARDAAMQLIHDRFATRRPLRGFEVDQTCREVITKAGYGDYFVHRTGHNIGSHLHGEGAHLDNLETQDDRQLLAGSCFSVEPGIYLPGEFGVRLEHDVLVDLEGSVHVTGGLQDKLVTLFA